MEIDNPAAKAGLEAAFAEYERALCANEVEALNRLFLEAPTTLRYGSRGENQYGYVEIARFRRDSSPVALDRVLARTVVTTYGPDFGMASTLYYRANAPGKVGRQMQTWVRTVDGWRIVGAHVSLVDGPDRMMP